MEENSNTKKLLIPALGVVFGDIGTSPLYALKSCFAVSGLDVIETNILGIISTFIWVLFLVTAIKYVYILLNQDNQGEGGILVLSSLCSRLELNKFAKLPLILGIIGASLFFGDGIITPSISVLGALEGLQLITPLKTDNIILLSIAILVLLFFFQSKGSSTLGKYFGAIMLIWFTTLGILGIFKIFQHPEVLKAFNPLNAFHFVSHNGIAGVLTLGSSILVVTGSEAIYSDLGHFGKKPIQITWTLVVFPCLILNYLGQGSLLLTDPHAISNPFYNLASESMLYPLIFLATISSIVASQSIITGVFSITWQAIMLNLLPRMHVIHTSSDKKGQVYIPTINFILCLLTIMAVLKFRTSENLAIAYGFSVSCVMLITTILSLIIATHKWKWSKFKIFLVFIPFLVLDLNFTIINLVKIFEGAWYAILISIIVSYLIFVWIKGSSHADEQKFLFSIELKSFINDYIKNYPQRIPGLSIFLSRNPMKVPKSLLIQIEHNKFLHEKILFISILTKSVPKIRGEERYISEKICENIYTIMANYGFLEIPDITQITKWAIDKTIINKDDQISCFLSKGIPTPSKYKILSGISEKIYIFMAKNSLPAYEFFNAPPEQVIELGIRYKV